MPTVQVIHALGGTKGLGGAWVGEDVGGWGGIGTAPLSALSDIH